MTTPDELYDQAVQQKAGGDVQAAIASLEQAVQLDPDHAISHGMLAKVYAEGIDADKAVYHAKRVVELDPDDAFSYTALSVVYQRVGMIPEAEDAKAISIRKQMGLE